MGVTKALTTEVEYYGAFALLADSIPNLRHVSSTADVLLGSIRTRPGQTDALKRCASGQGSWWWADGDRAAPKAKDLLQSFREATQLVVIPSLRQAHGDSVPG